MILSVKDNVKGIFLMTPYYMEPNAEDWMRKRMDTYGAICGELAEKYGCRFIDLQAVFNDYFQYRHSSYIAWDRIHPNQIGATVISGNRHRGSRFLFLKRAEVLSENCGWSRKKEKNCGKILLK